MLDEFIKAVHLRWPKALIQFEDFSNENALSILERYRSKLLCFNDDIQGACGLHFIPVCFDLFGIVDRGEK